MKAFADLIAAYLNNPGTEVFLKGKKDLIIKFLNDIEKYISENEKGTVNFINCIYQSLITHIESGKINSESIKKIEEFAKKLGTEEAKLFSKNMSNLINQYSKK